MAFILKRVHGKRTNPEKLGHCVKSKYNQNASSVRFNYVFVYLKFMKFDMFLTQ